MTHERTLWLVSGGAEAVPGIRRAQELGLFVVVSDQNPEAPGAKIANDFCAASTYDAEETARLARRYHREVRPIDGVSSVAADVPLTVATVAAELGLPGLSVETARLAADKLAMKERFLERGIPTSWFAALESKAELRKILADQGYPLVIKPVDSRGARGVLLLNEGVDLDWAFELSRSFSPSGRVMVEEYLPGPQVSTEGLILNDTAATPGFADRNYRRLEHFAPFMIEDGGEQPSALSLEDQRAISKCAELAGRALGVETGVIKGDMVLTPEGPKVIEIATRLSGGWFSTDQIPLATGVDLIGAAFRVALGESVEATELAPKRHLGVAIRYLFPQPGEVRSISGVEKVKRLDYVHLLKLFVNHGDVVESLTNHTSRAGCVITSGATRAEAVERAEAAIRAINIVTAAT